MDGIRNTAFNCIPISGNRVFCGMKYTNLLGKGRIGSVRVMELTSKSTSLYPPNTGRYLRQQLKNIFVFYFLCIGLCSMTIKRTYVDALVFRLGQIETRKLYLSVSVIPPRFHLFCINNPDTTFVIVYFCPQQLYKMCVKMVPFNILEF